MQSRRYLCFFLVIVPYIVFSPSGFPSYSNLCNSSEKILAEKIHYHSKLIISEIVLSALIQTWINRREKVRVNSPWPGYHRHHVNCPSPLGGRVYMPAERAWPTVLGKNQQICGNSQQSSSCFALLLEPCCFPYPSSACAAVSLPRAHRYCPCRQPPSQIQSLYKTTLFAVVNGCSPHCWPRELHLKPVCTEGDQAMGAVLTLLQLWSKPLTWSFLGFAPHCCAAGQEWLFSLELTMHPACHLCPNCICTAIWKAAFPNLIFFTSWINLQALHEFILLPGMEIPLSADTFALNVSDVELWHGLCINFLLMGKKHVLMSTQLSWTFWIQKYSWRQFWHCVSSLFLHFSWGHLITVFYHMKLFSCIYD